MRSKLLLLLFFVQSFSYAQTLVFPLSNGGNKDQGSIFKYDYTNGNHEALFFDHEIEKSDHRGVGTTSRESKGLYVSSNNCIYFTFAAGGTHVYDADANGQIIKYNLTTQEFSVVRSFSLLNYDQGSHPTNGFTEYNGKLYGVCSVGGANDNGVIYYIDLADDSYHIVHNFLESTDGAFPSTSLILENNKFYGGTTASTDGKGFVLYEFDPSNNNYSILHDNTGWGVLETVTDLSFKSGRLYYCSNSLIGYYNFSNNNITTVHQSTGANDVFGNNYQGINFSSNVNKHFVTAAGGGSNGKGAILELNIGSPNIVNVHSFGANGYYPQQELIDLGNGKQAGVTLENATDINGSLFEFLATNIVNPIYSFPNANTDGYRISGIPVLVNNVLYGFADEGGANGSGVFYQYDLATLTYSKIMDLGSSIGRSPIGAIVPTGNNDYIGLNARGGGNGYGSIFTTNLSTVTSTYENINNNIVEKFQTNLVLYNGLYYGVGLAYVPSSIQSFSVLYSYDPNTNTISSVAAIDPSGIAGVALPGSISQGNLLIEGDKLYGFTSSKIFEYNLTNSSLTYPHTFNVGVDGTTTFKAEIDAGIIYGVNYNSGSNGTGTLFKFDISNTTFTVLDSFTASTGFPINIGLSGNFLYGITSTGETNSLGAVFKYNLTNNIYSTIHDLDITDGYYRGSKLFLASDGNLYGTLDEGGQNGYGSIVKINTSNDQVTFPFHFSESTGNTTSRSMITEVNSSLSVSDIAKNNLNIYPNPATDIVKISGKNIVNVEIFNLSGKKVPTHFFNSQIDVSKLNLGIYIVIIHTENGFIPKKLIKI
ncbi:T9SS type A sorting domain-containing protein [Aestuariivivens marinum]|uniref:T9SS type A sorting domain-containing protein n=1 Tax=Aestuariivivens marinum TaxID=2913555 RepID=UPI001F584EB9|nr:T9SS type A sorting domain-containing protein [Aestuariivivens marinum]